MTSLRRRADAARRLPALDGRHGGTLAALDPWLPWPPAPRSPGTYGLTTAELWHEAERLLDAGWQRWELRVVLARPEPVDA